MSAHGTISTVAARHRAIIGAVALIVSTARAVVTSADELWQLGVTTDFVSGSVDVQSIDQQARVIRVKTVPQPDRGWPCWWYFQVTGIRPGETIAVHLAGGAFAQPQRATYSIDGHTWRLTAPGEKRDGRIVYRQKVDGPQAWFAWGPPFTPDDAAALLHRAAEKCPHAEISELCRSLEGRPVPLLRVAQSSDQAPPRRGTWIIARQHAWESGASWVCRGLVDWLVSDDPRAEAFRKQSAVYIVPIVDVDNVALGAGGKEERPVDHNRDWTDRPYHPAVAALQREIKRLDDAGRFDLFIDLHNPGPTDTAAFFFISPRSTMSVEGWANLQRFLAAAQTEMTGPLPYRGQTRESGPAYDARWRQIGKNWVTANTAGHVVSVTLETPWNTPHSTTDGYQALGRQLGLAIERYFRAPPMHAVGE